MCSPDAGSRWWMSATRPAMRVLDRDHGEVGLARLDRGEGVLEGRAGQRLHRPDRRRGRRCADWRRARPGRRSCWSCSAWSRLFVSSRRGSIARARSRSCGVSTPSGTASTIATSMRMPASSARNCSSFSRCLERRGRQRDEALERRAAIGIEADVVVERPLAPGRGGAGEIERAQSRSADSGEPTTFTTFGIGALLVAHDLGAERGDVHAPDRRAAAARRGWRRDRWSAGRPAR